MAETIFSLFADSCASSCNKKSMNQGQSIYSYITKTWRFVISHFILCVHACFFFYLNFFNLKKKETQNSHFRALFEDADSSRATRALKNTFKLSLKMEKSERKCPHSPLQNANLRRRHLTVTNQIRSVTEFSISAKLIRERKHNNCEWHISEGGDFKEQHRGTPDASSRCVLT